MGVLKFNFQVMNRQHPNSQKSTNLVSVFKARDSTTNLHTALDMYKEHLDEVYSNTHTRHKSLSQILQLIVSVFL